MDSFWGDTFTHGQHLSASCLFGYVGPDNNNTVCDGKLLDLPITSSTCCVSSPSEFLRLVAVDCSETPPSFCAARRRGPCSDVSNSCGRFVTCTFYQYL